MNRSNTPPERGVGLGLRLGLLTTLVVTGVMATLSGIQLAVDLSAELHSRRAIMTEALAPLVVGLQTATTREEALGAFDAFHWSYVAQGRDRHRLAVINSEDQAVVQTTPGPDTARRTLLAASVRITAPSLGSGTMTLLDQDDDTALIASRSHRWWAWATHVLVTAIVTLALLFVVIRIEVTGPLDRLLISVRKMERGYWDDVPDPGGAWEVRWLSWRFRALGHELSRTVERLVAAQRRAYAADTDVRSSPDALVLSVTESISTPRFDPAPDSGAPGLQELLLSLQAGRPTDEKTRDLAQQTWDVHAERAEMLGFPLLRMQLEDAALSILDPAGFDAVEAQLAADRDMLEASAARYRDQLHCALTERRVPVAEISHRVKHTAGIWKKIRVKTLDIDQIHDLVALRIVVPTEADCSHALGVVQDLFVPIVSRFKDYIADAKPNGYRGLHSTVRDRDGFALEVQIRSVAMHRHAERGPASHVIYKGEWRAGAEPESTSTWQRFFNLVSR